jgi:hypothetical protein
METDCKFSRECAQHNSAGEYREDSGFSPELYKDSKRELVYCNSIEMERSRDLGKSEFPINHGDLGFGYTPTDSIPEMRGAAPKPTSIEIPVMLDDLYPQPITITIENGNYEGLQEFIVNLGGCFQRKEKLENMTIKQIIDLLSPNVKKTTNIDFKLVIDKK